MPSEISSTNNANTTMHKEMDIIDDYQGREWQVVSLSNASEPGSVGEPEILYKLMDRQGNVRDVMDWELDLFIIAQRKEKNNV